jgi:hypothetical protein
MIVEGRRALFVLAATMALTLAGLIYFLFVVRAPEEQETSSARVSQASTTLEIPRLTVPPPPRPLAGDETSVCGYGRVQQDAVEGIHAQARKAADGTFGRLKAKLADSRDERESALGLYLQGSTDTLVRRASASRNPQAYALAFLSCCKDFPDLSTSRRFFVDLLQSLSPSNGFRVGGSGKLRNDLSDRTDGCVSAIGLVASSES